MSDRIAEWDGEVAVSVIVHYRSPGTLEQYGLVQKQLLSKGAVPFPGQLVHAAYEVGGQVQITEVWERESLFFEHAQIVMPLMIQAGMKPGHPEIRRIAEFRSQP